MSELTGTKQDKEQQFAKDLREFLSPHLFWQDRGGYPILYTRRLWGSLVLVAFLTDNKKIVIENKSWVASITESVRKYEEKTDVKIEIQIKK